MSGIKTTAAVMRVMGQHLTIEELEIPELLPGQVLVEVYKSGICGRQVQEISGAKGPDKFLPHLLGHEGGGRVLDTGPGVTTVKPGECVCMHWRQGPGMNAPPPKYRKGDEIIGAGQIATLATLVVVSENRLTAISDEIPPEIAALLGCSLSTGLGLITNEAKLKIGQSIGVIGTGGVGLAVIKGASMVSAFPIIGIDLTNEKLNQAITAGATHVYKYIPRELENIPKADVYVDTTGNPGNIDLAYQLTKPGGKTILVGQPWIGSPVALTNMSSNFQGKTIIDSEGGRTNPAEDIPRYCNLYLNGKLDVDNFITHDFKLKEINKAFKTIIEGKAGRIMITL